jgi:hypothetical protein
MDANKKATAYLVNHLRDPFGTVSFSQAIEAPVGISFVHTDRAAELRWWNGYLITYHSFNDLILLRGHYQNSFNRRPDKICMMMTRLACNRAIESSYWRTDNASDVGLLTGYVLYRLPIELESMDLDTFPC